MAATPEVIADLTGYTAYLSGSEIEHAPAIAGDLLETIVGRLEPPLRLTKFEGDAAFLFAEDDAAEVERIRADKVAAFGRMATTVASTLPVVKQREVRA